MIQFSLIVICILILYTRTYKHQNVIDDICTRHDYLRVHTKDKEDNAHYEKVRPLSVTIECVGTHILNCLVIQLIWGWKAALLYGVSPLLVHCVAWKTGALIYGSSTFLLLVGHYFVVSMGDWGLIIGALFYYSSITCSLSTLTYPFYLAYHLQRGLETPQSALFAIILYFMIMFLFLSGKRFQSALKGRLEIHENVRVTCAGKWDWRRIFIIPKVIAYYITCSLTPPWRMKGGFFSDAPRYIHKYDRDGFFWLSMVLFILFYSWAWVISPQMCVWHLVFALLYSQFKVYGMIVADRYQSVFTISTCVLLAEALPSQAFTALAALWFYRCLLYVKIWATNERLFRESMKNYIYATENCTNLASDLMRHGRWHESIYPLLVALKTAEPPVNPLIYQNLSVCNIRCHNFSKALEYTNLALQRCPLDGVKHLQKQKRDIEGQIKRMQFHQKTLKRRGII